MAVVGVILETLPVAGLAVETRLMKGTVLAFCDTGKAAMAGFL